MDNTTELKSYSKIKKMLKNPTVKVTMILPEKEFIRFNFDRFVYIKTKDLNGHFFVEKIDNYKDGVTPVTVYLLYVD